MAAMTTILESGGHAFHLDTAKDLQKITYNDSIRIAFVVYGE